MSEEILLKQQKRKWKEKDIEITQERYKGILQGKQDNLVRKELEHEQMMNQLKEEDKEKQQKKFNVTIKELQERAYLMDTLTKVICL